MHVVAKGGGDPEHRAAGLPAMYVCMYVCVYIYVYTYCICVYAVPSCLHAQLAIASWWLQ